MKIKFTETNVSQIDTYPNKDRYIVWDTGMKRFGIRIDRKSGKRTFVIQYSINDRQMQQSLGDVSQLGLKKARELAMAQFALTSQGIDPVAQKAREEAKKGNRFESYIDGFLAYLAKPTETKPQGRVKKYIDDAERSLRIKFKSLHGLQIGDILRSHISKVLNEIEENSGYRQAGISRAQLSSFFTWIIQEGFDGFNPVEGTASRKSQARERPLSAGEIRLIWQATEELTDFNVIVRLTLLTAARRTLIGALNRTEIDWGENVIDFSKGRTKTKQRFWVPMSRQVRTILEKVKDRRTDDSGFVFGDRSKAGFNNWDYAMIDLRKRVNTLAGQDIDEWVLHDFRSTFQTLGQQKAGIKFQDTEVCLHHTAMRHGTAKHYNHADYLDEKRVALQTWADYVDRVVHGERQLKAV